MAGRTLIVILICSFHELPVQALPQAKLTVTRSVIRETDSVSLSCQAPSHVSVHQCYFYVNGRDQRLFSCVKTFTGAELLLMSQQTSPAVVEARCFYSVMYGTVNAPSPHSAISYITISLKPQLSFSPGEYVSFTCSLPGSVKHDTTCNLYFGESNRPAITRTVRETKSNNNQFFCQFFLQEDDFLRRLYLAQQKDASCDYSLENDEKSLSPRSDPYSLAEFSKSRTTSVTPAAELNELQTTLTSTLTTGQVVKEPHANTAQETSGSENQITTLKMTSAGKTSWIQDSTVTAHTYSTVLVTPARKITGTSGDKNPVIIHTDSRVTVTSTHKTTGTPTGKNPGGVRWAWLVGVTASGITLSIIILVLACVRAKRRTEKRLQKRKQTSLTGELTCMMDISNTNTMPAGKHGVIQSVSGADCPTGSDELYQQKTQHVDSDVYHMYSTISEFSPPPTNMVYSLLHTQ